MHKIIAVFCLLVLSSPALAQSTSPAQGDILTGWREEDGRHIAGLSIQLAPGWKTYWRAPGEGGIPPSFNWSGSQNLGAVNVRYPAPKIMEDYGIRSVGYDKSVVFPLLITPKQANKPVRLKGEIEIGVCEEVCIPMMLYVEAELPPLGERDTRISAALADQPVRAGRFVCEIEPISDGLRLTATAPKPAFRIEGAVVEPGESGIWTSPAKTARKGNSLVTEVDMVPPNAQPFALARNEIRLTFIGAKGAIEHLGCQ